MAQPKASAPRLHQSNPAHKHGRTGELAEWVSRTHSQRHAQPAGASPRRSSQPAKTGHFYSATNRTFLLGVDKDILRDDPCNKVHYNARLEGRNFAPDKELAYALVVSVQAKKISDLYDTIVRKFAPLIEPLRPVVEIPITV